jgi:xeroderma pigmentosum group C-complementing protein
MIPKTCAWVPDFYAKQAAESLGIKYAEACTGFKFRGGRATPNVCGVVIHSKMNSILTEKIKEISIEQQRATILKREEMACNKWNKIFEALINARRLQPVERNIISKTDYSVLNRDVVDGENLFDEI